MQNQIETIQWDPTARRRMILARVWRVLEELPDSYADRDLPRTDAAPVRLKRQRMEKGEHRWLEVLTPPFAL